MSDRRTLSDKGERTRQHVLTTALGLFRKRGFEATTMRDIAEAAGLSLGAAYHYFRSKQDVVMAHYRDMQRESEDRVRSSMSGASSMQERLAAVMHTRLDVLGRDRKLAHALFQGASDPTGPLGIFSPETRAVRDASIAMFREAIAGEDLPGDMLEILPPALWALQMGLLLYFVNDRSPRQARTRRLVDDAVKLVSGLIVLIGSPFGESIRTDVREMLRQADLLPGSSPDAVSADTPPPDGASAASPSTPRRARSRA